MDIAKKLGRYRVPDDLIREIQELIARDPLTGLYNRRFFNEALANAMAVAERYQQPLSLVLLDVNHFKAVNDQQGYAAGDQALQSLAKILQATCREADIICRYGGDEFVILLPNTEKPGADRLVHRIQTALPEDLTIAAGTAALPGPDLLSVAEAEMRRQKQY